MVKVQDQPGIHENCLEEQKDLINIKHELDPVGPSSNHILGRVYSW